MSELLSETGGPTPETPVPLIELATDALRVGV